MSRHAVPIELSPWEETTLTTWGRSWTLPLRQVQRARIVQLAAAGMDSQETAATLHTTPTNAPRRWTTKRRPTSFCTSSSITMPATRIRRDSFDSGPGLIAASLFASAASSCDFLLRW